MSRSISFVLPVYNAEKFLVQCVDSILKIGNALDWELILVDDESKDSCPTICDRYSANDSRIKTFHIENKGVSNARNFGIKQVSKDFVTFVDADDWIDSEAFVDAFNEFVKLDCDMGFTSFIRVQDGKETEMLLDCGETRVLSDEERMDLLQNRLAPGIRFMGSVWRNFFSRDLLLGLAFDCSMKFHEDLFFDIQALYKARRASVVNKSFYYYRINTQSATMNNNVNSVDGRKLIVEKMNAWSREVNLDLSFAMMRRRCVVYSRLFENVKKLNGHRARIAEIKKIHKSIPASDMKLWKPKYFGKSFLPYVIFCRYEFRYFGFLYLCLRFF